LERAKEWVATHDDWYNDSHLPLREREQSVGDWKCLRLPLSIKREIDRMTGGSQQLHVQGGP